MAELAMKMTGFEKCETAVMGDRLYTDIACGLNAGISTIFVLSGEGTKEDIEEYKIYPNYHQAPFTTSLTILTKQIWLSYDSHIIHL